MRSNAAFALFCALALIVSARQANAAEPAPGDVCPTLNNIMETGGPETSGIRNILRCDGAHWLQEMTIDATGKVGIGTVTPNALLSLGNAVSTIKVAAYDGGSSALYGMGVGTNELTFGAGITATATEQMALTTAGNLGIGVDSPTYRLDVDMPGTAGWSPGPARVGGNGSEVGLSLNNYATSGKNYSIISTGGASGMGAGKFVIADAAATAPRLAIDSAGNVGIGTTSPQSLLQVAGGVQIADDTATCPGAGNAKVGTIRYDTDKIQYCNTTGWTDVASASNADYGTSTSGTVGTAVQATAGGIVTAYATRSGTCVLTGLTDGSNPPTTTVNKSQMAAAGVISIAFAVKSGNYYEVTQSGCTGATMFFTPLSGIGGGGGGSGDNLGNHIATQNIQLNGNWLSNDGGNEGIRINNSGDVGIGTSNPGATLHISDSSNPQLIVSGSTGTTSQIKIGGQTGDTVAVAEVYRTTNDITSATPTNYERLTFGFNHYISGVNSDAYIGTEKGGTGSKRALLLLMGSTELMRLATNGNVGIGTTSPGANLDVDGSFGLSGVLSPGALAANTDNWNPSNLATATVIRASASAAINLTGLAGGVNGRVITIENVGSSVITLKNNVTSTAANRFQMAGGDLALAADQTATFIYDNTTQRWRLMANGSASGGGGGSGDNLGNHIATQNIQLGSNWLSGDGDNEGVSVDGGGLVGISAAAGNPALGVNGDGLNLPGVSATMWATAVIDNAAGNRGVLLGYDTTGTNVGAIYADKGGSVASNLGFYTADSSGQWAQHMLIDGNGDVGIGTGDSADDDLALRDADGNGSTEIDIDGLYIGTDGATNSWIWNSNDTQLTMGTNGTDAITIDTNGNVGIGQTGNAPWLLTIDTANGQSLAVTAQTTVPTFPSGQLPNVYFNNGDINTLLALQKSGTGTGDYLVVLDSSGNTKLRMDSSGYVYIGDPSDNTYQLSIGDAAGSQLLLQNTTTSGGGPVDISFLTYDTGGAIYPGAQLEATDDGAYSANLGFLTKVPGANSNALAERMRITSAGNVGIGQTNPKTTLDVNGYIEWNGVSRVTSDFTKTSNTTLAAITGLSATLVAGKTYAIDIVLYMPSNGTGLKFDLSGGTVTATALVDIMNCYHAGSVFTNALATSLATALSSNVSDTFCELKGTITVNAAGTLIPRAAQFTSSATALTIKTGSTMTVQQIN